MEPKWPHSLLAAAFALPQSTMFRISGSKPYGSKNGFLSVSIHTTLNPESTQFVYMLGPLVQKLWFRLWGFGLVGFEGLKVKGLEVRV